MNLILMLLQTYSSSSSTKKQIPQDNKERLKQWQHTKVSTIY